MRLFASDNNAGVHPSVLEALLRVSKGHVIGYGDDEYTRRATATVRNHFGQTCDPYFVFSGGAGNVIALAAMLRSHESVICAECAHINMDECGAPERLIGCKLIDIPTPDGKLRPGMITDYFPHLDDPHQAQAKVISITNPTELGTVYTIEETGSLVDFAHGHGLKVHVDGARLANAAASLNVPLAALTTDVEVDVVTFGGTKNGMMYGETVLVFDPEISRIMPYVRKQYGQLASKMRYIAAQFEEILSNDLWFSNAVNANRTAQALAKRLIRYPSVALCHPVESNAIFVTVPRDVIESLLEKTTFYVWDEAENMIRLMCSFDTTLEDVEQFDAMVAQAFGE